MKIFRNLLASVLLLSLGLAACQTAPQKGTATPTAAGTTATLQKTTPTATKVAEIKVDAKTLEGVQITYLHPWSGDTGRMMDILVDEFNQSNEWGIHVKIVEPGSLGLAIEQLNTEEASAESEIDLAALPAYIWLEQDENANPVADLYPYVLSDKVGFSSEELADFTPVFWNHNIINGKLYGIPAQESAAVLFYNESWAKELGYSSAPSTKEAFKLQACAANASFRKDYFRTNDSLGGWIISTDADTLFSWLTALKAVDASSATTKFKSAKVQTAFEFLYNLQKDACAWSSRQPEPYDYFATRQALFYSGTTQDILPQMAAFERSGLEDEWKVIAYPGGKDSPLLTNGISYGVFESDGEKQLAAWLFIRWISQPINQARLLQTSGSLPLGTAVLDQMKDFEEEYPKWAESLSLLPQAAALPAQANEADVRMVLDDTGSFLFRSEFTTDKIPDLLSQLDSTLQELGARQP